MSFPYSRRTHLIHRTLYDFSIRSSNPSLTSSLLHCYSKYNPFRISDFFSKKGFQHLSRIPAGNLHFPRPKRRRIVRRKLQKIPIEISSSMSLFNQTLHKDLSSELSKSTSIFGLRLWAVIGVSAGVFFLCALVVFVLCFRRKSLPSPSSGDPRPTLMKEVPRVAPVSSREDIRIEVGESEDRSSRDSPSTTTGDSFLVSSHVGWGHWYSLREVEEATGGLADENVIREGGHGIVYKGVLPDNSIVAVKNLLNNKGQAERDFKVEVEAIGHVRHKNLVRLLGYCTEGANRMLVSEYVDNGNLFQWLHGDVGQFSPLTWEIRMNIIVGTAKGLGYLHEGLEPKVVHRDVKSSHILLDRRWNPKVSDFGIAKLLCSKRTHVTTRVMGTFGYVAPEYAITGMLTERSDVYSFGILIMEIVTGRNPVDYSRPTGEVNLVQWLKTMIGNRKYEEVVDPKILEKPSPKALKRVLLVAVRCVDPDPNMRPTMGNVIHMLEGDNLLSHDDRRIAREEPSSF